MGSMPWLLGGGALALYLWQRDKSGRMIVSHGLQTSSLVGRWVWPVPMWKGRKPVVSNPATAAHHGVDLLFARDPKDPYKVGSPNGSKLHVMPDNMVALAASDGIVWNAQLTPRGYAVTIDHGNGAATFYTHLSKLLVTPTKHAQAKQRVKAGQAIGIIGASPTDPAHLKHLHFELWRGGPNAWIDPAPHMRTWEVLHDPRGGARNGGLVYRPVGASGEAYPNWVRALKDRAGVYVIREKGGEIVYVGSSAGRLYDTLTRHFQTWRRFKGFWKGQYAEGHDPGLTYERDSVEVAIRLTTPAASLDEEMRLIRRLKPRDNLIGQPPAADEVPF